MAINIEIVLSVNYNLSNLVLKMIWFFILSLDFLFILPISNQQSYLNYHNDITNVEKLIGEKNYSEALDELEGVFADYDFIFLRDYKIATQLAFYNGDEEKSIKYLKLGISRGWEIKEIKKNQFLTPVLKSPKWKAVESQYEPIRSVYLKSINDTLRTQVHEMFKKDQKKALGALFRIGNKAQEKYGLKKFAPHSELQMARLDEILHRYGYPGEKLIGNNVWMSMIVSHHNSSSYDYVINDTIYPYLRPKLIEAIKRGEMSPYEFALMEDWKSAVETYHSSTAYGYLGSLKTENDLNNVDQNRTSIGLRTVSIRNALVEVESATGMDFYLPGKPWQDGKITIVDKN